MKVQAGRNHHRCRFKELENKQEIIGECVYVKSKNCREGKDKGEQKGVRLKTAQSTYACEGETLE